MNYKFFFLFLSISFLPLQAQEPSDMTAQEKAFYFYDTAQKATLNPDLAMNYFERSSLFFEQAAEENASPLFYINASVASYKAKKMASALFYLYQAELFLGSQKNITQNQNVLEKELKLSPTSSFLHVIYTNIKKIPLKYHLFLLILTSTLLSILMWTRIFLRIKMYRSFITILSIITLLGVISWGYVMWYQENTAIGMLNQESYLYQEDNQSSQYLSQKIPAGTNVTIIDQRADWVLIKTKKEDLPLGWVQKDYINSYRLKFLNNKKELSK